MKRVAAVAVAATLALTGLAGCGRTNEKVRAAGIVPADSIAFVSANLAPSIAQKANLQGILSKFPYKQAKQSVNQQLDTLFTKALADQGLNYTTEVKPWLGNELAIAVVATNPPTPVALIESKDDTKAKATLEKAKARPGSSFTYQFVKHFAVITDAKNAAAIDKVAKVDKTSESLAGQAKFTRVEESLHGDRLLLGWVDGKQGLEAVTKATHSAVPFNPGQLLQGSDGFIAFDVHAGNDVAVLEAVSKAGTTAAKAGEPRLTNGLPANALGAITVFDLAAAFNEGLKNLGVIPGVGNPEALQRQIQQATGLNLQTDLLSWMHGETVIVAAPSATGTIPDFALVVAPSDRAAAEAGVAKLKTALSTRGFPLVDRDIDGTKASVAAQPLFGGLQPGFALFPDRFVLAGSPGFLSAVAKSSSATLAGTDEFRHTIGTPSNTTSLQVFVRIAPIRDQILKAMRPEARAMYERDTAKFVEPLEALSIRSYRDGSTGHFEAKLSFK